MGWGYIGILFIVSAILSAVGFYKYVYFLSIGYGFSIAGIGACMLVFSAMGSFTPSAAQCILCLILILYGARLSGFLLYREMKNEAYKKTLKEVTNNDKRLPIFISLSIWICVAILYVGQSSPIYFSIYNGKRTSGCIIAGIIICLIAIVIESLADYQKSMQKKENPNMVATKGLYRFVRCPNYFGEILFWTGILVSGLDSFVGIFQWWIAIAAYIAIVGIMFSGASRLEKRQMKRYEKNPKYHQYADHTPILIPFLPFYHLNK